MNTSAEKLKITERAQQLLKVLIEQYINAGQPVGSKTLAQMSNLSVSSATIRNVMAELEDLGLVSSLHTSSGRVPTAQGYRFFVDCLLKVEPIHKQELSTFQQAFIQDTSSKELAMTASGLLSRITHLAGVVTLPKASKLVLRHVEFLPLSPNKILVILIVDPEEVQNRIIHTDKDFSPGELNQVANYINNNFAGMDLHTIRDKMVDALKSDKANMTSMMETIVALAEETFPAEDIQDCVVEGQTNLLEFIEGTQINQVRQILEAFSEKRQILHLLDKCIDSEGIQLFIGAESGYKMLEDYSIVTAPYKSSDDEVLGVLGVIGPTRMHYERVIPIVDVTAKLLSTMLKGSDGEKS